MPKLPEPKPRFRFGRWMVVLAALVVFASSAWGARELRRFLTVDPRFTLEHSRGTVHEAGVTVLGARYTSVDAVQRAFLDDYGRSVFEVDLAERRRRLLAIGWVEDASVSRVWPNRIYVRVRERKPVAYVNVPHQAFLLVDLEGVLLSPPPKSSFGFPVVTGINREQSEVDRKVRVQAAMHLMEELGPLAKDVSEIHAESLDDMRVISEVDGKTVELWLGDSNFGQRYRNFVERAADIRAGSPHANTFDLRIDDRITAK